MVPKKGYTLFPQVKHSAVPYLGIILLITGDVTQAAMRYVTDSWNFSPGSAASIRFIPASVTWDFSSNSTWSFASPAN